MGNMLQSFIDKNFGEVRTYLHDGEAWFVAADICRILEIKNPRMVAQRLAPCDRMTVSLTDGHSGKRGGPRMLVFVNESGLWSLVFRSRSPKAQPILWWLTHTVLPSIRKNGGYIEGQENLSAEEFEKLKAEIKALKRKIDNKDFRIARLEAEVEELEMENLDLKKAEYAHAYSTYINEDY